MGSSRLISRRRQDQGFKWARISMAVLATIGVIDTGSITLSRWGWLGAIACPGGSEGCDKVLNSAWGTLVQGENFSVPLSFVGLIAYLGVLIMAIAPLLPGLSENKTELSRRTWWGLFLASCGMSVFSLILIGLMLIKINALCFFCFLSAFISLSLLILSIIGGAWEDSGKLIFRGFLFSLIVLLAGLIWASTVDPNRKDSFSESQGSAPVVQSVSNQDKINLAEYLTNSGIVQYSAYWCPHCHEQKEMFGKAAAAKLNIIECAIDGQNNQHALCQSKGIEGFPSWEINGEIYSGVRSLNELAKLSKYEGPKNF